MKNKVNYEIKNAKINYYNAFFKDNRKNIKNTWKGINGLIGNESKFNKITQLDTGDTVSTDPIEISNILNTHFSRIGPSLASEIKIPPVILLIILPPQKKIVSWRKYHARRSSI